MKKQILILLFSLAAAAGLADAVAGEVNRYELNVGEFDRLSVEDGINVEYYCSADSAGYAVYETTKDIADQLIFDFSKKGRLLIQKQFHGEGELSVGLPVVRVYSKFLTRAQNSGDSTLRIVTVAPCPEFKATVIGNGHLIVKDIHCTKFDGAIKTGNGQLVVSGKADKAVFSNTGVGSIQADALEAQDVSCRFFGTGTTGVWVSDVLTIKGMFPGKLYYKGTPRKKKNYSMGVKIFHMEGNGRMSEETSGEGEATPADGATDDAASATDEIGDR